MAKRKKCYFFATPDEIIERCLLFLPPSTSNRQQIRSAAILRTCKRIHRIYLPVFYSHLYLSSHSAHAKFGQLNNVLAQYGANVKSIKLDCLFSVWLEEHLDEVFQACTNIQEVDIALTHVFSHKRLAAEVVKAAACNKPKHFTLGWNLPRNGQRSDLFDTEMQPIEKGLLLGSFGAGTVNAYTLESLTLCLGWEYFVPDLLNFPAKTLYISTAQLWPISDLTKIIQDNEHLEGVYFGLPSQAHNETWTLNNKNVMTKLKNIKKRLMKDEGKISLLKQLQYSHGHIKSHYQSYLEDQSKKPEKQIVPQAEVKEAEPWWL